MQDNTIVPESYPPGRAPARWRQLLAEAIRNPAELLGLLDLPGEFLAGAQRAARQFPLVVPRGFAARMRRGDPTDPLLRQVLPLDAETRADADPAFTEDPVDDATATRAPGLLQKYAGRALLVASGVCAINCRYCFRRHYPYDDAPRGLAAWKPALDELAGDPSIREIILSGGDPLTLTDTSLARLAQALEAIPHLRRLRIHTRLPIVLPERVDAALLEWLEASRLTCVVVVHANHPRELDGSVGAALARLLRAQVPVLNQTVLLRGVNDDEDTLARLGERLVDCGVLPYYLHQLDPVSGAAHFHVPVERGRELHEALRRRLPGYAVPRYVQEVPGEPYKVELRG